MFNVQPNSKFHPSYQNFLDPLLSAGLTFFFGCAPTCTENFCYLNVEETVPKEVVVDISDNEDQEVSSLASEAEMSERHETEENDLEVSRNSSFVSTERNEANALDDDPTLEEVASTTSLSRSRQPDSESEPTTIPQQAEHDVQLHHLDNEGSYERTARLHFNPSTNDISMHGNLGRGAAAAEGPSNGKERRSMSRQNSAAPTAESMGLFGGPHVTNNNTPHVTNNNTYISNCNVFNSKFGSE